jgi:putative colanic acid biosynthesis acetyltransferase WcaF
MSILDAKESDTWNSGASFTFGNRVYRLAWSTVWLLLASWTPPPLHRWRCFLLRLFGAKIGRMSGVYASARIWSPVNLEMGEATYIGPRVRVYSMAKISFGSYSVVSQGAHLCAGTHDFEDENFQLLARPITVRSRAWIAADAFVGPGVTINEGAILGARGCAFKDLDAWTVYAGNPARPIKKRVLRGVGRLDSHG